ncbi:MAG: SGNH/GDSL hydrolase family protein [Alphaproteobacteria bacterium]|nr:SGNH/GDSL hydrolase family protein [Alphaproteobacteria bacterium]
MARTGRELSLAKRLGFGLLFAAVLLVATEGVLRVATKGLGEASIPDELVRSHVQAEGLEYDPVLGWRRARLPDPHYDIDLNQFRRKVPIDRKKPDGGWRAFTFGDSQTYGAGLTSTETYSAVAERTLQQAVPDRVVEVVNTGCSGYGTLQGLRLMRDRVVRFEPDLYIVDSFPFDNPRDEVLPPASWAAGLERVLFHWRTYYVLRFSIERAQGRLRPMRVGQLAGEENYAGNHDSIMALAAQQGVPVVFLDYPFWDSSHGAQQVTCLAPASELPEGARVLSICSALQDSGMAPSELFLDNNHMSATGARIAGEALADALREAGLGP